MRSRERRNEQRAAGGGGAPGSGPPGEWLDGLRERGHAFLDAADSAIDRALSGSSEKFLEATRQDGGQ